MYLGESHSVVFVGSVQRACKIRDLDMQYHSLKRVAPAVSPVQDICSTQTRWIFVVVVKWKLPTILSVCEEVNLILVYLGFPVLLPVLWALRLGYALEETKQDDVLFQLLDKTNLPVIMEKKLLPQKLKRKI